jgi:sedoheptulokinase
MTAFLGIDIGTSKAAASIIDSHGAVLAASSVPHNSAVPGLPPQWAEQRVDEVLDAARGAVSRLPQDLRQEVAAIGVTGQMHGVVIVDDCGRHCSNLVTWQDQRCDQPFLEGLESACGRRLRTGYGGATLAWLAKQACIPGNAACGCTIHDLLVSRLCGMARPVCDPTDAASWGLFDLSRNAWDTGAASAAGIEERLLPAVVPSGSPAGTLCGPEAAALGLTPRIPVAAAVGDNQASLLATLQDPERELALTLGTGGQLSAVLPRGSRPLALGADATYEYRPFPGDRLLAAVSSLCGGAAWKWLADMVQQLLRDTGNESMPQDALYALLNTMGSGAREEVTVRPHFLGERHDSLLRGSIEGLDLANCSLGALARGLARGIVLNLRSMLPEHAIQGRVRVVLSGNALRRNALLREMAQEVLGMDAVLAEGREEAASGAALLAASMR